MPTFPPDVPEPNAPASARPASAPTASAPTATRILDATLEVLTAKGLARLALEDVAGASGVSRQTVYRHFGNRNALLRAVILREEEAFFAAVTKAAAAHEGLRPAIEAAVRAALETARAHPLLDRLLDREPEALLPYLTTDSGPVLAAARPMLGDLLAERLPHLSDHEVRRAADVLARLVVSYTVNPGEHDPATVAASIARLLVDGLEP